jgi:hypothetical protein
MEYVRTMLPTMIGLLGIRDAEAEIGRAARLVGMQFHEETAATLGLRPGIGDAPAFGRYLAALLAAEGEDIDCQVDSASAVVRQRGWRLMKGVALADRHDAEAALRAWNELWTGAALSHDRFMSVTITGSPADTITWTVGQAGRQRAAARPTLR